MSIQVFRQMLIWLYAIGFFFSFFCCLIYLVITTRTNRPYQLSQSNLLIVEIIDTFGWCVLWPIVAMLMVYRKYDDLRMMIYLARIAPTCTQRR